MAPAIQKERRNKREGAYQVHSLSMNVAFAVFQTRLHVAMTMIDCPVYECEK
jgi:hypothetical protein